LHADGADARKQAVMFFINEFQITIKLHYLPVA